MEQKKDKYYWVDKIPTKNKQEFLEYVSDHTFSCIEDAIMGFAWHKSKDPAYWSDLYNKACKGLPLLEEIYKIY